MAVLIKIAGTGAEFLAQSDNVNDIAAAHLKYQQAFDIYEQFRTNLPETFEEPTLDNMLEELKEESSTPQGPSYSGNTDSTYNPDAPSTDESTPLGAIRAADYMSGYAPLPVKVIGAMFNGIFGNASQQQQDLANAIETAGEDKASVSALLDQVSNLDAATEKYDSGVKTIMKGALKGFLTGGPAGALFGLADSAIQGATSNRVSNLVSDGQQKTLDGSISNFTGIDTTGASAEFNKKSALDSLGDISFGATDVNTPYEELTSRGNTVEKESRGSVTRQGKNNVEVVEQSFNSDDSYDSSSSSYGNTEATDSGFR